MTSLILVAGLLAGATPAIAVPAPATTASPGSTSGAVPTAQTGSPPAAAMTGTRPIPHAIRPLHRRVARPSPAELRVRLANRKATQAPQAQGFVNALQVYPWGDGVLYRLLTAPGQVSDIALQPGETITSVAAGDTARWTVGDTSSGAGENKRVHVLVKPFAAGLATNLVIATDRRIYHVQLTSTAGTAMEGLSWTYPADDLLALKRKEVEAQAAAPVAAGLDMERLTFSYVITGASPAWRPLRAFDDGRQTFIEFPASIAVGEAPPLFVIGVRGEAELVNYRMNGRFYVVDRLFDIAELRLGGKPQAVVRITRSAAEAAHHGVGRGA